MFKLLALAGVAMATLAISPAEAATFYTTSANATGQQTAFQIVNVGGQFETQTTISLTNLASFAQDLGLTWVSRELNGVNAPWNQADLSYEAPGLYATPDTPNFYAYNSADTDVVPPAASGYQLGNSLDFFDFGTFTPGQTKQQTLVFLVSSNLTEIHGTVDIISAIAAVPEPASWAMFIGGFGAIGFYMRRRRTSISFA